MSSTTSPAPEPALSILFHFLIDGMCREAADRAGRDRRLSPMVLALWPYLKKLAMRFDALLARIRAGQPVRPLRNPVATNPAAPDPAAILGQVGRPRPVRDPSPWPPLPRGFGFLLRLGPNMACYRSRLSLLLDNPEMVALLEADPRMARLLRPLCRMLGHRLVPPRPSPAQAIPARVSGPDQRTASPSPAQEWRASGAEGPTLPEDWPFPA